jgi:hypothetical protein
MKLLFCLLLSISIYSQPLKYGALIFGSGLTEGQKNSLILSMGCELGRDDIILQYGITSAGVDAKIAAGLKMILITKRLDYGGGAVPFATAAELPAYQASLQSITYNSSQIEIGVCDDEETNTGHYLANSPITDYLGMLTVFATVMHSKGMKATNGGIHSLPICILTYKWLLSQHRTVEAAIFKENNFTEDMALYVEAQCPQRIPRLKKIDVLVKKVNTLVRGYAATGIDCINLHWKEPLNKNSTDSLNIVPGGYSLITEYLTTVGGLPVMSNEFHILGNPGSVQMLNQMMQEVYDRNWMYISWFSENEVGYNQGLHTGTTLNIKGYAYKAFVESH